jgi:uncharacterized membrane protein HdeD (DUF308 family)
MSTAVPSPDMGRQSSFSVELPATGEIARLWWLWLVTGVLWVVAALVILQFDKASITTVSIILGLMFAAGAVQQFVTSAIADRHRWVWILFGVLFAAASIICFIDPKGTFAALADILGFLFLMVGVMWVIRPFIDGSEGAVKWLGFTSGVLMIILAFWTSGQFFIHKAYTLLVFAGIWALMHGITDIFKAFAVRSLREE